MRSAHTRSQGLVFAIAVAAIAFGLPACGDSGAGDGKVDITDGPNPCGGCEANHYCANEVCVEDPGLAAGGAPLCGIYGFEPVNGAAIASYAGGKTRLRFVATQGATEEILGADGSVVSAALVPPYEKVRFEMIMDDLWPEGPTAGTFDLTGTGERGGALFMRGHTFCNDNDCAFTYIAEQGTLELAEPGAPGGMLTGALRDVRLKQVRIDAQTGAIIPFSSGKVWCLGDYRFEVEVPELSVAGGACVAEGTGNNIHDNVRDFTLQNCNGDFIDLHQRCGQAKAVWFVATAGWCGACEAFLPEAHQRYLDKVDEGLDLMVILGEDSSGNQPSLEYCTQYATSKGIDPAIVFVDHDGQRSWPELFDALNTYSGNSIGLPWNALLNGESMEYVWSTNSGTGDLYQAQQALLDGVVLED